MAGAGVSSLLPSAVTSAVAGRPFQRSDQFNRGLLGGSLWRLLTASARRMADKVGAILRAWNSMVPADGQKRSKKWSCPPETAN